MGLAIELGEGLQHDGPRRHVDAQRQCLGGEYHFQQPGLEELFHRLLEGGDQSSVMRRHSGLETCDPTLVPEHSQVLVPEVGRTRLGDLPYRCPLRGVGQPDAGIDETMGGGVATRSAEDEEDRGKHPLLGEALHGLDPIRALESAASASFQAEHVLYSRIGPSLSLTLDKGWK